MQVFLSNKSIYREDKENDSSDTFTKINLNTREVKAAKKIILKLLDNVKHSIEKKNNTSFYFTFLIVMNQMSQDLLKVYPAEKIKQMMKSIKKQENTD